MRKQVLNTFKGTQLVQDWHEVSEIVGFRVLKCIKSLMGNHEANDKGIGNNMIWRKTNKKKKTKKKQYE